MTEPHRPITVAVTSAGRLGATALGAGVEGAMVFPFRFVPDPSGVSAVCRQGFCGGAWLLVDRGGGIWSQVRSAAEVARARDAVLLRWREAGLRRGPGGDA